MSADYADYEKRNQRTLYLAQPNYASIRARASVSARTRATVAFAPDAILAFVPDATVAFALDDYRYTHDPQIAPNGTLITRIHNQRNLRNQRTIVPAAATRIYPASPSSHQNKSPCRP
jgi:hypothetical protein